MEKRKYNKTFIRLIILVISVFIFTPRYLNALPLPTGDSTPAINASTIGQPQYKPPVLASENTPPSATEIEEIIGIISNPNASEDTKNKALNRLYQIVSDTRVDVSLKQLIADGLLNIFGNISLSEGLNGKIIFLLKDIALTPGINSSRQLTIATTLTNSLTNGNFSFETKKKILTSLYYLISARNLKGDFIISANIKEQIVDSLLVGFNQANLAPSEEGESMVNKIISLLADIILLRKDINSPPEVSLEKQLIIATTLINALSNDTFSFYTKKKMLSAIYTLISIRDAKGEFLIKPNIKEQMANTLLNVLRTTNLDIDPENNDSLKKVIVFLLKEIALTPKVNPQTIASTLINSLTNDGLSFSIKRNILSAVYYFISARNLAGDFFISPNLKGQVADGLLTVFGEANLASNAEDNHKLKTIVIYLLQNIALTTPGKQLVITTTLVNSLTHNNFIFETKKRIFNSLYYLIGARDVTGGFLIPAEIKEQIVGGLLAVFQAANLDTYQENVDTLKGMSIFLLREIALTSGVSNAKKSTIATTLLNALTNDNFSFEIKYKILTVARSFISAQDTLIPANIKERMADLLSDAFGKPVDNNSDTDIKKDKTDILKGRIISLFKTIILSPQISAAKRLMLVDNVVNSLVRVADNDFSDTVKGDSIILINSILGEMGRGSDNELIIPVNWKDEHIVQKLLDFNPDIFNHPNLSPGIKVKIIGLFETAVVPSNVGKAKQEKVVEYLQAHLRSLLAYLDIENDDAEGITPQEERGMLGRAAARALKNIGAGIGIDIEIRKDIFNNFANIYNNGNNSLAARELIASYLTDIGRVNTRYTFPPPDPAGDGNWIDAIWKDVGIVPPSLFRTKARLARKAYPDLAQMVDDQQIAQWAYTYYKDEPGRTYDPRAAWLVGYTPEEFVPLLQEVGLAYDDLGNMTHAKLLDWAFTFPADPRAAYILRKVKRGDNQFLPDFSIKDTIAKKLNLNVRQWVMWSKFDILALGTKRDFSEGELTQISNVLDKLGSDKVTRVIKSINLFSAVNSGDSGWRKNTTVIRIGEGTYNPNDINAFIKFLSQEIGKAVYSKYLGGGEEPTDEDQASKNRDEFADLFEEYITDSSALINRAKAQPSSDENKLLNKVKIIIKLFGYTKGEADMAYTFKIENGQIIRTEVELDSNGLPK